MVEMYEENVEGIQLIHAVPAGKYHDLLPTVFFYHGFTSSKEIYSYFGYTLAKAGYRVILPDALMHGARAEPDESVLLNNFWRILQTNVTDLALLKETFVARGLADENRLGVGGVSMGGMTAMAALAHFPWVKVAANLMGSGYFASLADHLYPSFGMDTGLTREAFEHQTELLLSLDISDKMALIASKPLLVWHGEQDDVVPFGESARLRQALEAYDDAPNLTFISEPTAKHRVSVYASIRTTEFFAAHL
ncbi:esterase [Rouxiella silvae]|uniref:Esterase n=1 Tax=Rouxiella silvae TaxID=1646373 RepID=A0AA40X079_9GAMM|nr:esterase [Rouxiella silvae]MBF6636335.1 esterase [Rouxiella silvae]ORJ19587.1 esterase [Rouxiella silvae]